MNIGKYLVMTANNGETTVHYGVRQSRVVPIERLIDNYINSHLQAIRDIIARFDKTGVDLLADDNELMELVRAMPDDDLILGKDLHPLDIQAFHHFQIVSAYNRVHNTDFKVQEVFYA